MFSRRENLEFIKDQPDFRTIHDADELLDLIDKAWITNPGMGPRDWLSSAIKIVSYGDNMGNKMGFNFGGIVPMISQESDRWGLTSWDSFDRLRELCQIRDGEYWTTLVLSYRADTGEFSHQFVYGDDRPELDVSHFAFDDEVIRRLRPTRGTTLEQPVTARGAWTSAASFQMKNKVERPILKSGHYSVDRLDGGFTRPARRCKMSPLRTSPTPTMVPWHWSTTQPRWSSPHAKFILTKQNSTNCRLTTPHGTSNRSGVLHVEVTLVCSLRSGQLGPYKFQSRRELLYPREHPKIAWIDPRTRDTRPS